MKEGCEIQLEKTTYTPAEVITANLQCTYYTEHKVKGIRVVFVGEAKVSWNAGKYVNYEDEKKFLKHEIHVLSDETVFHPGTYNYSIVFTLPEHLPSSLEAKHGFVEYKIEAVVSRPWAFDYQHQKPFTVFAFHNLHGPHINNPIKIIQEKTPLALFKHSEPITISVELPKSGYALNEAIPFSVTVNNGSTVSVKDVRFQLIQGYEFHVRKQSTEHVGWTGQELAVPESNVPSGGHNSWALELKVPDDMPVAVMGNCELITVFWKLRGEIRLPFPHNNFLVDVPIALGAHGRPSKIP